jgi:hypothetical protein
MAGPEEIGKAKITVEADTSGIKASMADAKKEVEGVGDAANKSASKVSSSFTRAGEAIESSTSGVRKFVGALSSVAGVATGLLGVLGLVTGAVLALKSGLESLGGDGDKDKPLPKAGELLDDLADKASGLDKALSSSPGFVALLEQIEALETRIASLNRLASGAGSAGVGAGGQSILDIQDQISKAEDELQSKIKQRGDLLEKIARGEERAKEEAEAKLQAERESLAIAQKQESAIKSIQDILSEQGLSLLQDDQQFLAQAERQKAVLEDLFRGLAPDDLVNQALENVDLILERQLEGERERQRVADEAQRARDAESAARQVEAAQRAAQSFADALNGVFGADFTTRLDTIAGAIERNTNGLGRLK